MLWKSSDVIRVNLSMKNNRRYLGCTFGWNHIITKMFINALFWYIMKRCTFSRILIISATTIFSDAEDWCIVLG